MLAPIPPRRPSGKSSFRKLHSYLSEVMNPDTGELLERGEMILSPALLSAETAATEMWAVAAENSRVKDPVEHYVLTWQEGEQPTREQWEEAVRQTQDALGWKDHQWLAVAHADTDNFHVHVMANKVHPETYRSHTPPWMKKTLDKCCREIEAAQGWKESNGLYRWDEQRREAVPVPRDERERRRDENEARKVQAGAAATDRAGKMEQFRDVESLETYAKGEPAKALDAAMKRDGATWQDVHAALSRHGLELHKGERGGYTVKAKTEERQEIHVKASKAFRKHFAGKAQRAAVESKLGEWQPAASYVREVAKPERAYTPHRELKRDPAKRQDQREARARERAELKARFQAHKTAFYAERARARQADRATARDRYRQLAVQAKAKREEIRRSDMPAEVRRVARSVAAAEALQARERLRAELARERQDKARAQDYRTWLVVQAALGDKAAEGQLRGFAYQDRRNAAKEARPTPAEVEAHADRGKPVEQRQVRHAADPAKVERTAREESPAVALRMTWQANARAGTVDYYLDGEKAFTDRGHKVDFAKYDNSRDEIEAGLLMARQKFGREVNVRGSVEFKRQAIEIAVTRRIDLKFSDPAMAELHERMKADHAAALAEQARRGETPATPPAGQAVRDALRDVYRDVRDSDPEVRAIAKTKHPELAKALAVDEATQAAAAKMPPRDRDAFIRKSREGIERDLAAGKQLPDVKAAENARTREQEQDQDREQER